DPMATVVGGMPSVKPSSPKPYSQPPAPFQPKQQQDVEFKSLLEKPSSNLTTTLLIIAGLIVLAVLALLALYF
ncbi:MAG: hypothetical protein RMM17_13740, partial [Acidobacteriota bacterium]|nr:hypothetical protein [Acidobacteriota bacterium]